MSVVAEAWTGLDWTGLDCGGSLIFWNAGCWALILLGGETWTLGNVSGGRMSLLNSILIGSFFELGLGLTWFDSAFWWFQVVTKYGVVVEEVMVLPMRRGEYHVWRIWVLLGRRSLAYVARCARLDGRLAYGWQDRFKALEKQPPAYFPGSGDKMEGRKVGKSGNCMWRECSEAESTEWSMRDLGV